jgi:hypothetical protein
MPPRARGRRGRGGSSSRGGSDRAPASAEPQEVGETIAQNESSTSPSASDEDRVATASDPTPITIHGEKYYKAEDLTGKRKGRKKTSPIWQHGFEIVHVENRTRHYYCRLCLDEGKDPSYRPLVLAGNSSALAHFRTQHDQQARSARSTVERGGSATASPGPVEFVFQSAVDKFKLLLIRWIVFCHIAFFQIENRYFRDFLTFFSSQLEKLLPSRNTLRDWVVTEYKAQKGKTRRQLRKARSNIHLSFDLWTSPNYYTIISVVAHFIDSKGCRETKVLAIRRLKGEHSGENIAASVLQVIKEYKIRDRVGFFVLDNASSNDVAVDRILHILYPEMSEEARKRRRLRCLAHVTNLVAKAFYLGPKADDIVTELLAAEHFEDVGRMANTWQKQGALGRLQNIIRYIRLTPKRREGFNRYQSGQGLERV